MPRLCARGRRVERLRKHADKAGEVDEGGERERLNGQSAAPEEPRAARGVHRRLEERGAYQVAHNAAAQLPWHSSADFLFAACVRALPAGAAGQQLRTKHAWGLSAER